MTVAFAAIVLEGHIVIDGDLREIGVAVDDTLLHQPVKQTRIG
mgnify:CR=1 FL=1